MLARHSITTRRRALGRRAVLSLVVAMAFVACAPVPPPAPPDGSYEVGQQDVPSSVGFGGGTIYYPTNAPGRVGAISLSPGFTENQSHIQPWGPRLASHGFVVVIINTSNPFIFPDQRSAEQRQALDYVIEQSNNPASPIAGKVDSSRTGVGGHSMGGGASLISATADATIDAVLPLAPWNLGPDFSRVTSPTLVYACQFDVIAPVGQHASPMYDSIPGTTEKMYISVAGGDHFCANSPAGAGGQVGSYAIAFLKRWMNGDTSVNDQLCGAGRPTEGATFDDVRDTCPF